MQRRDCFRRRLVHREDRIELRHSEKIGQLRADAGKDEFTSRLLHGRQRANESAESAAIDVVNAREIDDDLGMSLSNDIVHARTEFILVRLADEISGKVNDTPVGMLLDVHLHGSSFLFTALELSGLCRS
jgi:hypothetical protein